MKFVKWIIILLYIYFILTKTIIGRPVLTDSIFLGLFWEVEQGYWSDIGLNILLFVPLGLLIGGWKGLVTGLLVSSEIETAQYFFRLGYCELDDVLNNTIGTVIGVVINALIRDGVSKWRLKNSGKM